MDAQAEHGSAERVGEEMLGGEINDPLTQLQAVGNSALHCARRCMAIGSATTALFAVGSLSFESQPVESADLPVISTLVAHPTQKFSAQKIVPRAPGRNTTSEKCSWITDFPSGYYEGDACQDDTMYKLHESKPGGYDYGEISVSGIFKCGWVKDGILKTVRSRSNTNPCAKVYKKLTNNPHVLLVKINCKPGKCADGTPDPIAAAQCDHNFYQNFATAAPTPLNMNPHGKSGFSDYVGKQFGFINYRGTIAKGSAVGGAIVVRSNTRGWGVMEAGCASPKYGNATPLKHTPKRHPHKK